MKFRDISCIPFFFCQRSFHFNFLALHNCLEFTAFNLFNVSATQNFIKHTHTHTHSGAHVTRLTVGGILA